MTVTKTRVSMLYLPSTPTLPTDLSMPVTAGFRDSQNHKKMTLVSIRRRPTRHNFLAPFDSSLEVSESIPSHDEYTDSHALTDGSVVANADVEDVVAG